MRVVVQRVTRASVRVAGQTVGEIGRGLCVLVGVTHDDDASTAVKLAEKLLNLRIFPATTDGPGVGDLSAAEVAAELLVVSQFTLYGDTRKGRRPSYVAAAPGEVAEPLVAEVVTALPERGATVATGTFGADMEVELVNDGPVTLLVEVPPAEGLNRRGR